MLKNTSINDKLLIGGRPQYTTTNTTNKERKTTMEIIKIDQASSNSKVLKYKLTSSPEVQKLSTIDDGRIDVTHYCFYDDLKEKNGEVSTVRVLAVMTVEGEIFGTNSATFQREFERILDIFEDELETEGGYLPVHVFKGMSKNNRTFLTCAYAD